MSKASLLARIEAAFDADRTMDKRIRVEVPEWDEVLFFPPAITLARRKKIVAGVSKSDEGAQMASYVMHEAQLEDGTAAFDVDVKTLAVLEGKANAHVLLRIMTAIGSPEGVPEAKNA